MDSQDKLTRSAWLPFGQVGLSAPGTGSPLPNRCTPWMARLPAEALVLVATVSWRRLLVVIGLALFASAAWPAAALAHDVSTSAGHLAEDAAPHDAAVESQLTERTRTATAQDARAAAAAVVGNEHEVGSWGPLMNWPVVGIHEALLPNGKVLAYDSVGDAATETFRTTRSPARRYGIRRPERRRRRT